MSFKEHIKPKDKHLSIFSPQMEAIVFTILQISLAMHTVLKLGYFPVLAQEYLVV